MCMSRGGEKTGIVIFGAGQQGRVCKRLAIENGYKVVAFIDDFKTGEVEGVPVYQSVGQIENFWKYKYFVGVGEIAPRRRFISEIERLGLESVNLIDRAAYIEDGAQLGTGNYICKLAIIYASAKLGNYNIINCKAVLATDSVVGNNCNVSMGCNLCGGVNVGNDCYIGCQASVVSECYIGDGSTVAAGSVVLQNVPAWSFVAGAPAVRKERKKR